MPARAGQRPGDSNRPRGHCGRRPGRRDQVVSRPPRHDRAARRGQRGAGRPRGDALGARRTRRQRPDPADGSARRNVDDRQVPRQARPRPSAAGLPGQRHRRADRAAARAGCPAALRRAAARHRELADQLHPSQGCRRRADRARRACHAECTRRVTRTTCASGPALPGCVQHGVCQCRRSSTAGSPRSVGHTTKCAVPERIS